MNYDYIKALHIIFVITWFAGLFYMPRFFIYSREANDKPEPERSILQAQLSIMARRLLYGITWPSAILTMVFGIWLLTYFPVFPVWLIIKLGFVVVLLFYHFSLHILYKQQEKKIFKFTSLQLRIWNELPTVILFAIVFLVMIKTELSLVYGLGGLAIFILLLVAAIKIYKKIREKK